MIAGTMTDLCEVDVAESMTTAISRFDSIAGILVAFGLTLADYRLLTSTVPPVFLAVFLAGTAALWGATAFVLWRALIIPRPTRVVLSTQALRLEYKGAKRATFPWDSWNSSITYYRTWAGKGTGSRTQAYLVLQSPVRYHVKVPASLMETARLFAGRSGLREVVIPEYRSSLGTMGPTAE